MHPFGKNTCNYINARSPIITDAILPHRAVRANLGSDEWHD
jgi:hypothetical protein